MAAAFPPEPLPASRAYAHADDRIAARQLVVTIGLILVNLACIGLTPWPFQAAWALPLAGLLVRLFVLQHDLGHHALFTHARTNDRLGRLTSLILGVPYHAWRTEHAWHHNHQGQLAARGIDRVNSPMTVAEAKASPAEAHTRARLIRLSTVFVLGAHSLAVKRKRTIGFFPFRPGFRWPIRDKARIPATVRWTVATHAVWHLALAWALGGAAWWVAVLPAYFLAAGFGALLFWVQHNFEGTWHADEEAWDYVQVALRGSSYLALPRPLAWFTADIGLHHVHHLNPRIPNYRLEEARRGVPALAAVKPLDATGFWRCFTHVFWSKAAGRMVSEAELAELPE
jgi:omega-6 fatty acid desaturase (delta-12 desaturase)